MEPEITHDEKRATFLAVVEGHSCEVHYSRIDESTVAFDHTFVHPDLRGRGIAATLVARALSWAREQRLRVVPSCSYVSSFMAKNPEWDDLRLTKA